MKLSKNLKNTTLTVNVEGRLDTSTSPELQEFIDNSIEGVTELILDFSGLEYISSAGLRVLLSTEKTMKTKGKMIVKNLSEEVAEVFEITGFSDILTIE